MTGKGSSGGKGSAKKQTPPSTGSKGKQQAISGFFAKKLPAPSAAEDSSTPKGAPPASTPVPKPASPKQNGSKSGSPGTTRKSPGGKKEAGPDVPEGTRITVWWPLDKAWYKGTVKQWDGKQGKHQVAYDDGEVEWVTLGTEQWRTLSGEEAKPDGAGARKKEGAQGKRGGRLSQQGEPTKQRKVVQSEDEDEDMEESASEDDSGSEFDAGEEAADDSGEEGLEDVESEGGDDGQGDSDAGPKKKRGKQSGSKRKQPQANGKGPASKKRASPTHTPATPANPPGHGAGLLKAPGSGGPPSSGTANIKNMNIGSTGSMQQGGSSGGSWQNITPQTGARKVLHSKLDVRTSPGTQGTAKEPQVVHGVATRLSNEDACRFQDTMAMNYPFLHPSRIMDAKKRRPDHPDYDPRTLYLPPNFFKENRVSPGQQQWWEMKAANFDSVLLFKQGKFYEMFEMDSYVGVDVLGLTFMKGEKPHAGFPEVRYHDMAEGLARAGYRVVVVEQTETPQDLARRNDELRKAGQKLANVVNREKVAVLSKGLLMDAEMVAAKPDPSYVISVCELEPCSSTSNPQQQPAGGHSSGLTRLGVCAVDVASGHILLGEFLDDEVRSSLRTHLAALQPVEVLLPRGRNPCGLLGSLGSSLDPTTSRVLRTALRDPRANFGRTQWDVDRLLQDLHKRKYFSQASGQGQSAANGGSPYAGWPPVLAAFASAYASAQGDASAPGAAVLMSLSGLVDFLEEALLDRAVLPMGRMEALPTISQVDIAASSEGGEGGALQQQHMLLNGAALENLEVLENAEGGVGGTLLSVLDHCSTPFGRRRLRQWLCRPLYQVRDIELRQDAVSDLMTVAAESAGAARKDMSGISDLERAVARLAASTVEGAAGRDADHVVLYEDAARRKVKALTGAIRDLQAVSRAVRKFYPVLPWAEGDGVSRQSSISSKLLLRLSEQSRWSQIEAALDSLAQAANWSEAEKTGRVTPAEGVDDRNDAACKAVAQCQAALSAYLTQVRKQLGGGDKINFVVAANRDRLLEVPDTCKITKEFTVDAGGKKGFKRYTTEQLAQLSSELRDAEDEREAALGVVLQSMVRRFVEDRELWVGAVEAVAELDALMSLAAHALNAEGSVCRPKLLPPGQGQAVFEAKGLRHPSGLPGLLGSFVPNDVSLGGTEHPAFIVLTGPNMGGKSTLLRQVCLAALLAQIGGCVPADSLTLSPVDAIFVRMGAKDHIMTGQSTFFVELAETAAMLHKATSRSLVALDELGRGTATLDGAAIASAVLHHMSGQINCRGLFATHYHHLSSEHAQDPHVAIMHMACAVSGPQDQQHTPMEGGEEEPGDAKDGLVPEVTFLYKLVPGACPKSYGTNVARLAGLPPSVVSRAAHMSATTVSEPGAPSPMDVDGQQGDQKPQQQDGHGLLGEDLKHAVAEVAKACAASHKQSQTHAEGGDGPAATFSLGQLRKLQQQAQQLCGQQS